jgi:putative salt-induced outer membrane protein YdiY
MKGILRPLIILILLCFSEALSAQIVNIESKRLGERDEGWNGSVELGLNLIKNTKEIWQINNRIRVQHKKRKHSILLLTDFKMVKADEADFVNKGFEHIRYNLAFNDSTRKIVLELFEQAQFNKIQKIDLRILAGGGLRIKVLETDSTSISFGALGMYEHEQLIDDEGLNQDIRLSNYLSFDFQFTKTFGLNTITYFQPMVSNFQDYRLSSESALRFKISDRLTFRVIYNIINDSQPPPGVPKTNYSLKNALKFSF